jgi:hypothetical protein
LQWSCTLPKGPRQDTRWHAGKRREAFDMFGRIQAFNSIAGAGNYLMVVRSF